MIFFSSLERNCFPNSYSFAREPLNGENCSYQSPDLLFVASCSFNRLIVTCLKPFCILGHIERDLASCEAIGENSNLAWHSESQLFALTTTKGFLLLYALIRQLGQQSIVCQEVFSPSIGLSLNEPLKLGLAGLGCLKFASNAPANAICAFKDSWLISRLEHPEALERIIVHSDGRMTKASSIYIFPPDDVLTRLEYIDIIDTLIWQSEKGEIFVKCEASIQTFGWNGIRLSLTRPASYYALNVKYKLLAVYSEESNFLTCYSIGLNFQVKVQWESELVKNSRVIGLKWSGNWSILLVEGRRAFEMFTFLGDTLEVKGSSVKDDSIFGGLNALFFGIGDYTLWLFPKSFPSTSVFSIPLAKLSSLTDNCSFTRKYPLFLQEDKISIAKESENSQLTFEKIHFPRISLLKDFPIRIVSVSPCGSVIFVAGNRGFAIFLRHFCKWLRNDKDFVVVCAPTWSESQIFISINDAKGNNCIQAYSIAQPNVLLVETRLARRVTCITSSKIGTDVFLLFVLDIDACLFVIQFHFEENSHFLSLRSSIKLSLIGPTGEEEDDSLLVSNMQIHHFKGQFRIFILQSGILSKFIVEFSPVSRLIHHHQSKIAEGVYFFDCQADSIDEFVAFRGREILFSGDFQLSTNGGGFGISHAKHSFRSITQLFIPPNFISIQFKNESISIPKIKHYIHCGKDEEAQDLLQSLSSPVYALEVLFYQFLESIISQKPEYEILRFLRQTANNAETAAAAIRVARKSEHSERGIFFQSISKSPLLLWNEVFEAERYEDALVALILLEEDSHLEECCLKLVSQLVDGEFLEHLEELVRFCGHLKSLSVATESLLWKKSLEMLKSGFLRSWNRIKLLIPNYSTQRAIQEVGILERERIQSGILADYHWADFFSAEEIEKLDDPKLDLSLIKEQSAEIRQAESLGLFESEVKQEKGI